MDCDDATGRPFEVTDLSSAADRDPALYEFVSLAAVVGNPPVPSLAYPVFCRFQNPLHPAHQAPE